MLWIINTGVITALTSFISLVIFSRSGFHYAVLVIALPHTGLYTLAMMAKLHSRTKIAKLWNMPHHIPSSPELFHISGRKSSGGGQSRHSSLVETLNGAVGRDGRLVRAPMPVVIGVVKEHEVTYEDGTSYSHFTRGKSNTTPSPLEFEPPPSPRGHVGKNITFQL